ncbi:MAG: hypothetical protein PWQ70_2199 [Clostridiales bacterium]|nr:hypothetical protein [Clostridiales bacterium]
MAPEEIKKEIQKLAKEIKKIMKDENNINRDYEEGKSIYIYTKKARKKIDKISWKIYWLMEELKKQE